MTEPFQAGILATDYARREGITVDAVYLRVKAGELRSYKVGRRVYVYPVERVIESEPESPPGSVNLPALIAASRDVQAFLAALAARDRELIAPWERRVDALEKQQGEDREQIGDLKRQVRELTADLRALQRARTVGQES